MEKKEKKPEVLYGYKVLEDGDQVAVWKENRAMMLLDKRLFSEDSLEGWRIERVLREVANKIREEEREKGERMLTMIGKDYGLLGKIDDLSGDLWAEYSYSIGDSGDWELSDSSDLLLAWLVATGRCTMDDLEAGLKVFEKIGDRAIAAHNDDRDFGPDDFVRDVMREAKEENNDQMD